MTAAVLSAVSALVLAAGAPAAGRLDPGRQSSRNPAVVRYDAIVDASYGGADGARVGGVARYRTIGAAVAAAPATAAAAWVVYIRNGRYREKLLVDRPAVRFVGESRDGTVLTYDDVADTKGADGKPLGTRGSWTLKVVAPDFRLERMTVENAFDYPGNYSKAADDSTRLQNAQALAVALGAGSDRAVFRDCVISGHQDTLFADAGRSYFTGCTILGSVDFIFGAGRAVFRDCDIVSRDRATPKNNGYIAAPSTPATQRYGFVFVHDRLLKATPSMAAGSVFLGRPWHPSADPTVSSSAVYIDCWMDDHIAADGWTRMSSMDASGTRVWYEPRDARFFEHDSRGPGAAKSAARRQMGNQEKAQYAVERVLDGWKP